MVHAESRFYRFADLRGASWAYNEPGSFSGYDAMRYHLASLGETSGYFSRVVASGAHQQSIQMILRREVDCSAIDSTVLEQALSDEPTLSAQLRVVDVIGPNPMPPWVVQTSLPAPLRQQLRHLLTTMHEDATGKTLLAQTPVSHFAAVTDADYDPIRKMLRQAESFQFLDATHL